MPRLVHLTRASNGRSIERAGLRGEKASILGPGDSRVGVKKAVFAMPQLLDFSVSHQWLRELSRWHDERMIAVQFRLSGEEPVWVGRYNAPHVLLPVGIAIQRISASPLGQELVIPRAIARREITKVRQVTQLVGWTETPEASKRSTCLCTSCLPFSLPSLMGRIRGSFEKHLLDARTAGTAAETATALLQLDTVLERARGRISAQKLLPFANDPDARVRRVATTLLSHFRRSEIEPALVERIADHDPEVRDAAASVMRRIESRRRL